MGDVSVQWKFVRRAGRRRCGWYDRCILFVWRVDGSGFFGKVLVFMWLTKIANSHRAEARSRAEVKPMGGDTDLI